VQEQEQEQGPVPVLGPRSGLRCNP